MPKPRKRIFTRAECIALKRCPDCEWHTATQGHKPECPNTKEGR